MLLTCRNFFNLANIMKQIFNHSIHNLTRYTLGPIPQMFFHPNSNLMEISFRCNYTHGHQITTKFCICHNSTAVVTCTHFCTDQFARIEVRVNHISNFNCDGKKRSWNVPWTKFVASLQTNYSRTFPCWDKMVAIFQTIFLFIFLNETCIFIKISLKISKWQKSRIG